MNSPKLDEHFGAASPPRGVRTMAIVRWVLVALSALIAVGSVLSYFGVSFGGHSESSHAGGKLYYCPMHPQIVQDHPGECPICSMTLVPKPEGRVKTSPTMQPATANRHGRRRWRQQQDGRQVLLPDAPARDVR